jgi:hypothetical protein
MANLLIRMEHNVDPGHVPHLEIPNAIAGQILG